jgi:phosphatidylserine synthase 2
MHTVRYFRAKKFNWLGLSEQPSLSAKVRRAAGQFLPWSYEDFDWQLTSGVCVLTTRARKLCLSLTWKPLDRAPPLPNVCGAAAGDDGLRAERFPAETRSLDPAAKRVEHVPPVRLGRCVLSTRACVSQALTPQCAGMALPAVKEYYGFVSCGMLRAKLGAFAWLSLACFALETLVCVTRGSSRRGYATELSGPICCRLCSSWVAECSRHPGLRVCVRRGPLHLQR